VSYSHKLKNKLLAAIQSIENYKELFVSNQKTDFTRSRQISITTIFLYLLGMQGKSLASELLDFYNFSTKVVSSSAMIQARSKLKLSAFESVFQAITAESAPVKNIMTIVFLLKMLLISILKKLIPTILQLVYYI
jgi:hypothetical protein